MDGLDMLSRGLKPRCRSEYLGQLDDGARAEAMADSVCRPSPQRRAEIQKTINPNQLNRAVGVINDQVLTAH